MPEGFTEIDIEMLERWIDGLKAGPGKVGATLAEMEEELAEARATEEWFGALYERIVDEEKAAS